MFGTFNDITTNRTANEAACAFIRRQIANIVTDPAKAAALSPHDVFARRPLCDGQARSGPHDKGGYYAQFNRPNVDIVPLLSNPIREIEPAGIRTEDGTLHELDVLIFATGFDAVEGNYTRLAIRGRDGYSLADAWKDAGPSSYLGVAVPRFPNLFMVNGPKGAFTNQPPMIEVQVEFVARVVAEAKGRVVEAKEEAEREWARECEEAAKGSLFWEAEDNWIFGANIPGKRRCLRFYFGGMKKYREHLIRCEDDGFDGFTFAEAIPSANGEVVSIPSISTRDGSPNKRVWKDTSYKIFAEELERKNTNMVLTKDIADAAFRLAAARISKAATPAFHESAMARDKVLGKESTMYWKDR
ncbi:hypothetical protein Q7P37_000743 [Cladosporium fusiforme]